MSAESLRNAETVAAILAGFDSELHFGVAWPGLRRFGSKRLEERLWEAADRSGDVVAVVKEWCLAAPGSLQYLERIEQRVQGRIRDTELFAALARETRLDDRDRLVAVRFLADSVSREAFDLLPGLLNDVLTDPGTSPRLSRGVAQTSLEGLVSSVFTDLREQCAEVLRRALDDPRTPLPLRQAVAAAWLEAGAPEEVTWALLAVVSDTDVVHLAASVPYDCPDDVHRLLTRRLSEVAQAGDDPFPRGLQVLAVDQLYRLGRDRNRRPVTVAALREIALSPGAPLASRLAASSAAGPSPDSAVATVVADAAWRTDQWSGSDITVLPHLDILARAAPAAVRRVYAKLAFQDDGSVPRDVQLSALGVCTRESGVEPTSMLPAMRRLAVSSRIHADVRLKAAAFWADLCPAEERADACRSLADLVAPLTAPCGLLLAALDVQVRRDAPANLGSRAVPPLMKLTGLLTATGDNRCRAAVLLADAGQRAPQLQPDIVALLRRLVTSQEVRGSVRVAAAEGLLRLDPRAGAGVAVDVLRAIATGQGTVTADRNAAVQVLARVRFPTAPDTAAALRQYFTDRRLPSSLRLRAAQAFAEYPDTEDIIEGCEALARFAGDPDVHQALRLKALASLAALAAGAAVGGPTRAAVLAHLRALTADRSAQDAVRTAAAAHLLAVAAEHPPGDAASAFDCRTGVSVLRNIADGPESPESREAVRVLLDLVEVSALHEDIHLTLLGLCGSPACSPQTRLECAVKLVRQSTDPTAALDKCPVMPGRCAVVTHPAVMADILTRLAALPAATSDAVQSAAVRELLCMTDTMSGRDSALACLDRLVAGSEDADPAVRLLVAELEVARVDAPRQAAAVGLMLRLATDFGVDDALQLRAADGLVGLTRRPPGSREGSVAHAIPLHDLLAVALRRVALSPGTAPRTRVRALGALSGLGSSHAADALTAARRLLTDFR